METIQPFLPEALIKAANHVIKILQDNQVDFRTVGGVAVSHYAQPRMTEDIDFIIPIEQVDKVKSLFPKHKALVMPMMDGFTTKIMGIDIDFLISTKPGQFKQKPGQYHQFPVADKESILLMKLESSRSKDLTDAIEILKHTSKEEMKSLQQAFSKLKNEEVKENFNAAFQISVLEQAKTKTARVKANKILLKHLLKT
jgi:hypothetical protein